MSNQVKGFIGAIVSGIILLLIEYGPIQDWRGGRASLTSSAKGSASPPTRPPDQPNHQPFSAPALALSPVAGPPGTDVMIHGSGFAAGEIVVIRFAGLEEIGREKTNAQGTFAKVVKIPKDWKFEIGAMVAEGLTSRERVMEPFQVTAYNK